MQSVRAVLPVRLKSKRWLPIAGVCIWVLLVCVGLRSLLLYANTPGVPAHPPLELLPAGPLATGSGRYALLLFLHPQCPCSRASIGELARIVAREREKVAVTAYFYAPDRAHPDFAATDLWESAGRIPGVRRSIDIGAEAARHFGARTSGQALLYDPAGHLAFSGGLTLMRGHSGDNDGEEAILALLEGREPTRRTAPVFGCALYGEAE